MRSIFVSTALRVGIVLLPVLLSPPGVSAAEIAGRLQFVVGDVSLVKPDGASRVASKGGEIAEGESIATGKNAQAQILMSDQALIAVRSDTLLKIETYRYSGKENENDRSFLGLLRGGFRAVTGQIGRFNRSAYQVRTPNATIGIRGTDHEPFYIPPPLPGQTPLGTPGTYDKVNSGATVLQTQSGRVELGPNQVGFVAQQLGAMPQKLPEIPSFMRNSTPAPQAAAAPAPQPSAASARTASTGASGDAPPSGGAEQSKSGQATTATTATTAAQGAAPGTAQGATQGAVSQEAVVQGDAQKSAVPLHDVSPASATAQAPAMQTSTQSSVAQGDAQKSTAQFRDVSPAGAAALAPIVQTSAQGSVGQGDMQKSAVQFRDVSPASAAALAPIGQASGMNPGVPGVGSGPPVVRPVTGSVRGAGGEFQIDASKIDTTQGGKVCSAMSGSVQIVVSCP